MSWLQNNTQQERQAARNQLKWGFFLSGFLALGALFIAIIFDPGHRSGEAVKILTGGALLALFGPLFPYVYMHSKRRLSTKTAKSVQTLLGCVTFVMLAGGVFLILVGLMRIYWLY